MKRQFYNLFLHIPVALAACVGALAGLIRDIIKSAIIGFHIGYGE